jgi:hypothetical protein
MSLEVTHATIFYKVTIGLRIGEREECLYPKVGISQLKVFILHKAELSKNLKVLTFERLTCDKFEC